MVIVIVGELVGVAALPGAVLLLERADGASGKINLIKEAESRDALRVALKSAICLPPYNS